MENKWLYYRLEGNANIENAEGENGEGLIKVTLLDEAGIPNQPPLHFDTPLAFITLNKKVVESIGTESLTNGSLERNVNFNAGFDETWFNKSIAQGFTFTDPKTGASITTFTGLIEPDEDCQPDDPGCMAVVKPGRI